MARHHAIYVSEVILVNAETLCNICLKYIFPAGLNRARLIATSPLRNLPISTQLEQSVPDRILDTAKAIYTRPDGLGATMEEIARAAGLGRATLYRHFSNRDDLLLAVMVREANLIAAKVDRKIRHIESPGEHIIEGMVQAMREMKKSDLFNSVLGAETGSIVNRLIFSSDRMVNIGLDIMLPVVQRAHETGKLKTDMNLELLMEWIMRMLTSLLTVPSKQLKTERDIRYLLQQTMLPVLEG
jgi:AcrR family transcriptional regulator